MSSRPYAYITRPRADYYDDSPVLAGQTVIVEDERPIDTGLYDADGVRLYRLPERLKVGYIK